MVVAVVSEIRVPISRRADVQLVQRGQRLQRKRRRNAGLWMPEFVSGKKPAAGAQFTENLLTNLWRSRSCEKCDLPYELTTNFLVNLALAARFLPYFQPGQKLQLNTEVTTASSKTFCRRRTKEQLNRRTTWSGGKCDDVQYNAA